MTTATVVTDASFHECHAGWAAWVRVNDLYLPIQGYGIIQKKCKSSSVAEIYAALNGLWLAHRRGGTSIVLRSDCKTVEQLNNNRIRNEHLNKIWGDGLARDDMRGIQKIEVRHVKGHTQDQAKASKANRWCDRMAKKARIASQEGKAFGTVVKDGWD